MQVHDKYPPPPRGPNNYTFLWIFAACLITIAGAAGLISRLF